MSDEGSDQLRYIDQIEEIETAAARMRHAGAELEEVAAILLSVASLYAARAAPDLAPARVRDWMYSCLSLKQIRAAQSLTLMDIAEETAERAAKERRAQLYVINRGKPK
jgi:hypothetical protein